jgi:hypothetical protein
LRVRLLGGVEIILDSIGKYPAPVAESPFVGRVEWSQLNEAWRTAREGGAHLLLVTGEPGSESRLALELGRHVRAEGNMGFQSESG